MKSKKKNNNITVIAVFAVILTIIALIATSGTYAKYTSSIETDDARATIAKWDVKVNVGSNEYDMTSNEIIDFDLFDTIIDPSTSLGETDVASNRIAPGTQGAFEFSIENESEVNITYSVVLQTQELNLPQDDNDDDIHIPIKFALDAGGELTWVDASGLAAQIAANADTISMNSSTSLTIRWKWDYSVNSAGDIIDTALGIQAQTSAPQYIISATITATQKD